MEKNRRIGTSMSGIAQFLSKLVHGYLLGVCFLLLEQSSFKYNTSSAGRALFFVEYGHF